MKMVMKGIIGVAVLSVLPFGGLNAESRVMGQVFSRWIDKSDPHFQYVFRDVNVQSMAQEIDAGWQKLFNERYFNPKAKKNTFSNFFVAAGIRPSPTEKIENGGVFSVSAKQELTTIFGLLQNDIPGFIAYLKKSGLEDAELNKKEAAANFNAVIDHHKSMMSALFASSDCVVENEYLFSVANHFFEYCFSSPTWSAFNNILKTPMDYPIARLLYSTMWYNLAGNGWKDWHETTLKVLQNKCRKPGQYVTYIAGGSDIYQLLNHDIYTIKVIDPMLPSQPKYYSEGWDWLVRGVGIDGGINDELTITTNGKQLLLKRVSYQETGSFKANLSTKEAKDIPQSVTVWDVCDQISGEKLGEITFDRRFCNQADFTTKLGQNLLISFNELFFITTQEEDSWGINPRQFPKDFTLFVKQLRRPVSKDIACHLRQAENSSLSFIKLGSCIN